jgi:selenocysteine-specific elongation factor
MRKASRVGNGGAPPLCLGTAGHVDHGKTWLVRALTGKDTDRLPEEKARGISIDLGYAPLQLPDGRTLSVVDVPGHERFVHTMVAGAAGIDLFLLVIDAAEGPRPQTHEHVAILRLLRVGEGVVAVTKADAVDAAPLERVLAEARDLVPGAAVVPVSAKTGRGLDALRGALAVAADRVVRDRACPHATRLFLDRVFTLRGIGTVATGTLRSGTVREGDQLRAEPAGLSVRVRSVQVHDRAVACAHAGQRVAVGLPGVERRALRRGDALVEPGAYVTSYRLDVVLDELEPIHHALRLRVHHGTAEIPARVVRAGTSSFAQLRLASPAVAARDDRVVLRTRTTVGGGRVVDPAPPRHNDRGQFERAERGEIGARTEARTNARRRAAAPLPDRSADAARLEHALAAAGLRGIRIDDGELAAYLEREKRAVKLTDGFVIAVEAYEEARRLLVAEANREDTITLARFRDLLATSRRPAQRLLERFDADRVTRRVGDERILRRAART